MNARTPRASSFAAGAMLLIAPAVFATAPSSQQYTPERVVEHLAGRAGTSLGPPGGEVRALAQAATRPERLYLGTATGHIYASRDGAVTWTELPIALGHEAVVDNLLVHPGDAERVYAAYWTPGGNGGLVQTRDGGATWHRLPVDGDPSLRAIAAAPSNVRTIYVGGIGGVWRSDDGGDTWRNVNGTGLATDFVESLAVDPRDPDHVYAGTWRQVYRSRDGGATWRRIYQGMAVDRDIFTLTISPHDPDTVLAGTCNFLYRSENAGGSWGERREGLATDHNRIHTIVHDPRDDRVLYAGTRGALYRSLDAGASWSILVAGVSISALALDVASDRLFVGTEERGVLVGRPGETFKESNAGLASARVVGFDALPGAPRVLFAARADGPLSTSIHFSTNIGETWQPLGVTPSIGEVRFLRAQSQPVNRVLVVGEYGWWSIFPGGRWVPVPAPPGSLAGIEIAHEVDGSIVAVTDSGLYVAAAEALADVAGGSRPFDADDSVVWRPLWTDGGLRALTIGGSRFMAAGDQWVVSGDLTAAREGTPPRTFHVESLGQDAVVDLALHPENRGIAYAASRHAIFRTADSGATWERLPLPWPAAELRSIAVDPVKPDQVLALDYRGAVYRGHGDGLHWLVLDEDPGLERAWTLRLSAQAPGYALVATQGHGLRVIELDPLASSAAPGRSP